MVGTGQLSQTLISLCANEQKEICSGRSLSSGRSAEGVDCKVKDEVMGRISPPDFARVTHMGKEQYTEPDPGPIF